MIIKETANVTLSFEITIDDKAILQSGNDPEVKALDLALLHQLIKRNHQGLKDIIAESLAFQVDFVRSDDVATMLIGERYNASDFVKRCFLEAINAIEDEALRKEWQELATCDDSDFSIYTENILECFEVKMIKATLGDMKEG